MVGGGNGAVPSIICGLGGGKVVGGIGCEPSSRCGGRRVVARIGAVPSNICGLGGGKVVGGYGAVPSSRGGICGGGNGAVPSILGGICGGGNGAVPSKPIARTSGGGYECGAGCVPSKRAMPLTVTIVATSTIARVIFFIVMVLLSLILLRGRKIVSIARCARNAFRSGGL
jgi:hypothetical protein